MTVTVTLPTATPTSTCGLVTDYVKHQDGSLDVVRGGARQPLSYAAGDWTEVEGNQSKWQEARVLGRMRHENLTG